MIDELNNDLIKDIIELQEEQQKTIKEMLDVLTLLTDKVLILEENT